MMGGKKAGVQMNIMAVFDESICRAVVVLGRDGSVVSPEDAALFVAGRLIEPIKERAEQLLNNKEPS